MQKQELYNHILNLVSVETEISITDILSCKKQSEIVDARSLFVYILNKNGFYVSYMSERMSRSTVGIRKLIAAFDNRKQQNKILKTNLEHIEKKLEIN